MWHRERSGIECNSSDLSGGDTCGRDSSGEGFKSAALRRKSGKECKSKVVPWNADTVIVGSVLQDSESEREGHQLGGSTTEYYQMFERSVGVQATSRVHTRGCQTSKTTKDKTTQTASKPVIQSVGSGTSKRGSG